MRVDKTYPIYRPCTQRGGGGIRRGLVGKAISCSFFLSLNRAAPVQFLRATVAFFNDSEAFGVVEYKILPLKFLSQLLPSLPATKDSGSSSASLSLTETGRMSGAQKISLDLSAQTKLIKLILLICDIYKIRSIWTFKVKEMCYRSFRIGG